MKVRKNAKRLTQLNLRTWYKPRYYGYPATGHLLWNGRPVGFGTVRTSRSVEPSPQAVALATSVDLKLWRKVIMGTP